MKRLPSLIVTLVLLAMSVAGCGGTHKTTSSVSAQYTPQAKLGGATPAEAKAIRHALLKKVAWVRATRHPPLPNDGDHDQPGDEDHDNSRDTGTSGAAIDPYLDYLPPANNRAYHDEDDEAALGFGRPADARDARAVKALVKRYYAAATRTDGAGACSLLMPSFAKAVPLDYGKFGASYLHKGKTCPGVLRLLFEHLHRELVAPVQVTEVRVSGPTALAFMGSKTMPAGYISLHREGSGWTVGQVLGGTLQ